MSGVSNVVYWLHAATASSPTTTWWRRSSAPPRSGTASSPTPSCMEICKFEEVEKERPLPLDTVHSWQKEVKSR